jgi:branched-chain amino acid transport system substrate-binding protein
MTKQILKQIYTVALGLVILSACNHASNTINIGATLDFTGPNAVYGNQVRQGLDLAIEEINKNGGIEDKKVKITYLDSHSDPKTAVTNTQQLISVDNCKILIGEISSSATLAMIPVVEQNNAFLFAPASSSPKLTDVSKNFARNWPSDDAEAGSAAEFAISNFTAKTSAIIYVNSDYGLGLKDKFTQVFESKGGKVVDAEPYGVGTTDFRTILLKVKDTNPDCIYLAGNPKEMGACIKQLRENDLTAKIISNTGFLQNDCLSLAGKAANGVVVPTPEYNPTDSTQVSIYDFYKKFKAKYHTIPTMVNANAYDAIYLIKEAIENVGDNPLKISAYIRNKKDFTGATGKISFVNGDVEVGIVYMVVENGKAIKYKG